MTNAEKIAKIVDELFSEDGGTAIASCIEEVAIRFAVKTMKNDLKRELPKHVMSIDDHKKAIAREALKVLDEMVLNLGIISTLHPIINSIRARYLKEAQG